MYVNKKKFNDRSHGLRDVTGQDVDIEWGDYWPHTDGDTIFLPDNGTEPWDDQEMLQGAWDHEMSHIMFDTDIPAMFDWIKSWSSSGPKHNVADPLGTIPNAAETVIQTLEDQRIESLYGDLYYGAKKRFENVIRENLSTSVETPAMAVHAVRCGCYSDVADEYDRDLARTFYEALESVEFGTMDTTLRLAEEVMQEIFPWYKTQLEDAFDDADNGSTAHDRLQRLKEKQDGVAEEMAETQEQLDEITESEDSTDSDDNTTAPEAESDEQEQLQRELEHLESKFETLADDVESARDSAERNADTQDDFEDIQEIHDTDDSETINDSVEDSEFDIDGDLLNNPSEDMPERPGNGDQKIGDITDEEIEEWRDEQREQLESIKDELFDVDLDDNITETIDIPVIEKPVTGVKTGKVYHGVVKDLVQELRLIRGKNRTQTSTYGDTVDVPAVIDSESTNGLGTELFNETISETGFNVTVLVDLSHSMLSGVDGGPSRLNVARNVSCTLAKSFDELKGAGFPVQFKTIGYTGSNDSLLVKEANTVEETRRLSKDNRHYLTPTWHAIKYATEDISTKSGKKLVVLVTDGVPSGGNSGEKASIAKLLRYTRDEIERSKERGVHVYTVSINMDIEGVDMRSAYGNYADVDTATDAGEMLLEFIQSEVRKHIQRH